MIAEYERQCDQSRQGSGADGMRNVVDELSGRGTTHVTLRGFGSQNAEHLLQG